MRPGARPFVSGFLHPFCGLEAYVSKSLKLVPAPKVVSPMEKGLRHLLSIDIAHLNEAFLDMRRPKNLFKNN
jgi:hypothetical protein